MAMLSLHRTLYLVQSVTTLGEINHNASTMSYIPGSGGGKPRLAIAQQRYYRLLMIIIEDT